MAGMAAAAYAMGNPWIMGGIGAAAAGFFAASIHGSKQVMETMLHRHPETIYPPRAWERWYVNSIKDQG